MAANSKRAKLGPQIMGGSAAPAGSLRTMAIARRSPHGAAAEPLDNGSTATAPTETPAPAADELFYKKGAATAATFRPNYWTYESNRAAVEASEGLEGSGPSEEELSAGDMAGLALVIRPSRPPANDPPPATQAEPPAILPEVAPAAETPATDSTEPAQELVATAVLDEPSFITAGTETPLAAGIEAETETLAIPPEVTPAMAEVPEPDFAEPAPEPALTAARDEASFIAANVETTLTAEVEAPAIPPEVTSAMAEVSEPDFVEPALELAATTALDEPSSDTADIETSLAAEAETPVILSEVTPVVAEASEPDFAESASEFVATTTFDGASSDAASIETPPIIEAEPPTILSEAASAVTETSEPSFAGPEPEPTVTVALDEPSYDAADIETPLTAETEVPAILPEAAPAAAEASEQDFAEPVPALAISTALDEPLLIAANIETPPVVEAEALAILSEIAPVAAETPQPDFAEAAPEFTATTALDESSFDTADIETPLATATEIEAEAPATLSEVVPAVAMAESDSTEPAPEPAFTVALDEPLPTTASETTTPAVDESSMTAFDLAVPEAPDAMASFDAAAGIDVSEPPASDGAVALFDTPTASEMAVPSPSVAPDEAPRRAGDDLSQTLQAAIVAPPEPTIAMASENYSEITPETVATSASQAMPAPLEVPVEEELTEEEPVEATSDFAPTLEASLPASDAALWETADADAPSSEIEPPATDLTAPPLAAEAPPSVAVEEAERLAATPIAPQSDLEPASLACEAHPAAEPDAAAPDIAGAVGEAPETISPAEAAPIIAAPPSARKEKRPEPRLAAERAAQDAGAVELAAMIESVLIDKSYQKAARSAAVTPLSTAMRMGGQPRARPSRPRPAPTPATPPKPLAQAAPVTAITSVAPKRRASNRLLVLVCLGVILPATFYATALRHGDTQHSATPPVVAPATAPADNLMPETASAFSETATLHPAPIRPSHKPHYPVPTHSPVR